MDNLILSSATVGIVISLLAYEIGLAAQRKWKLAVLNPLLISIILVIAFLVVFHVDYGRKLQYECQISELSSDTGNGLSGYTSLSSAGSVEEKYSSDSCWCIFRSARKSWNRTCNVSRIRSEP